MYQFGAALIDSQIENRLNINVLDLEPVVKKFNPSLNALNSKANCKVTLILFKPLAAMTLKSVTKATWSTGLGRVKFPGYIEDGDHKSMDEIQFQTNISPKCSGEPPDHNEPPGDGDKDSHSGTAVITKSKPQALPKPKTREPSFYKVVLLNDDFTPMEFVVHILQKFFQKNFDDANRVMLQVHHEGSGIAGVFTFEIAETKVYLVHQYSKQHKYPLKCTLEKA